MSERNMKNRVSTSAGLIIIAAFACGFLLEPMISPSVTHEGGLHRFLTKTSHVVNAIPAIGGSGSVADTPARQIAQGARIWMILMVLGIGFTGRFIFRQMKRKTEPTDRQVFSQSPPSAPSEEPRFTTFAFRRRKNCVA